VAADVCCAEAEGCVVCLFGCWVEELAFEREGDWRKAAKKVERKKGRWEDMLPLIFLSHGRRFEISVGVRMVVPVGGPEMHEGSLHSVRP
jgi:hypothetical protein